jgi:hypothetical protein
VYWQSLDKNNVKLPTVLPFLAFNTTIAHDTMAVAILTEKLDFVGESVGQGCGCETGQGDQY